MPDPFAKPELPAANNSTGPPQPPSGTHASTSPQAVVKPAEPHVPSDAPAKNIHK
jgi:hypothetical protein